MDNLTLIFGVLRRELGVGDSGADGGKAKQPTLIAG
jgi:hypothetical protein